MDVEADDMSSVESNIVAAVIITNDAGGPLFDVDDTSSDAL